MDLNDSCPACDNHVILHVLAFQILYALQFTLTDKNTYIKQPEDEEELQFKMETEKLT